MEALDSGNYRYRPPLMIVTSGDDDVAKLTLVRVPICLGILSIAALMLSAASLDNDGVIAFPGKVSWAWATRPSPDVRIHNPNPAGLVVIFSNLGKAGQRYEDTVGWDVAGTDSGVKAQWVAMPFIAASDAEVTRIVVAIEYNSGSPNSFELSLNFDNGGTTPGNAIRTWTVKNAPKFGTCCTLDVVTDAKGLRVNKGTQYWVVAETNPTQQATRMEWDISPRDIESNFAFNNGNGWHEFVAFTSAFAVYGRQ